MSSVIVKDMSKDYGAVRAVKGVSLEIAEGELVALLGPSGCGKTTTLRCIAGLEDISGGSISMGERLVSAPGFTVPPERRDIGMVFQSYAIWPHMTVAENVAFGLRLKKLPRDEVDSRVARALTTVGLSSFAGRGASQLSGGQQQRVALARAMVLEPGVLLFDEPLSNLDAKLRERMRFELRELLQALKITSVYVTHDQQEAMVVADRVVLMNEGLIEQVGAPREMYQRPASLFSAEFIGLANRMRGEVVRDAPHVRVRTERGLELDSASAGVRTGQAVEVVVRPEALEIAASRLEGSNALPCSVVRTYFLGNLADIYLRVGQTLLRGQLSPPREWAAEQEAWVRIAPEAVLLFPAASAAAGRPGSA